MPDRRTDLQALLHGAAAGLLVAGASLVAFSPRPALVLFSGALALTGCALALGSRRLVRVAGLVALLTALCALAWVLDLPG